MNKTIHNENKYLSSELVEDCFVSETHNVVDKRVCGNGFSTGFLNLDIPFNMVNIMIAPNKSVIMDKEKDYKDNPLKYKHRIKFFYQESTESDFGAADVLVFVSDSFINRKSQIGEVADRVDKVLIDEVHSIHQQSSFRKSLVNFENKVRSVLSRSAIVSVTASPILYSKVDITISNVLTPKIEVLVSKDRKDTLERIKEDIKVGNEVVVFTNSSLVINALKDYQNKIRARIELGDSLKGSIAKKATIVEEYESKLTIASSRGFEGFDIHYDNASVYFFEDRASVYESFYISNLYQALNRTRKGAKYIELCRQELSKPRKNDFSDLKKELKEFIDRDDISFEKKMGGEFARFRPYYYKKRNSEGKYTLFPDTTAVALYYETLIYDLPFPQSHIKEFCNNRNLSFRSIENVNQRLTGRNRRETKIANLYLNREFLDKSNIFGESHSLKVRDLNSLDLNTSNQFRRAYLKELDNFLIEKNYNGEYKNTERQSIALDLLEDEDKFLNLLTLFVKTFNKRSIEKYGVKGSKRWRDSFKGLSANYLGQLLCIFSNDTIYVPKNYVAHRDYNILTKIGMTEIKLIAEVFNITVTEIDIATCYPRIIYALNGRTVPSDFYGENKKNKVGMNALLNSLLYTPESNVSKKIQKRQLKNRLRNKDFDEDIVEWLLDKFFNGEHKDDFYNTMAFYERMIIEELYPSFDEGANDGLIRRHDSLLIFNNEDTLDFLPEFTCSRFVGIKGWFKDQKQNG
jgi:hypothetical protein